MAHARKRGRAREPQAARVSRKMAAVRPLRGQPAVARKYDLGFKPPADSDRETGEGEPEVNG